MTLAVTDTVGRRGGFRGNFEMYISAQLSCIPTKGQPVPTAREKPMDGISCRKTDVCASICAFAIGEGCIRYSDFPSFFNFPMKFPSSPHGCYLASLPMKSSRSWKKTSQSPRATSQNVVGSVWWNLFKIWTRNALHFQIAYLFAMEQPDFQWLAECYKQQVPAGLGMGMCLLPPVDGWRRQGWCLFL